MPAEGQSRAGIGGTARDALTEMRLPGVRVDVDEVAELRRNRA
jgi:hypothetical protein